jgi:hypothetical protein
MEEARKRMKNEQTSYEDDIDPNKKIVVKGVKGMNSKSFTKKFRNMKAADKWMDDNEDDIEVKQVMNEEALSEAAKYSRNPGKGYDVMAMVAYKDPMSRQRKTDKIYFKTKMDALAFKDDPKGFPQGAEVETIKEETLSEGYYDYPDYGPIGASEMAQTQLQFIKYAADDITRCLNSGCPMPEWYQNKLAKMEGDMEGLYSYMKGKTRKMKARQSDRYSMGMSMYGESTLTEAKSGDKEAYRKFFDKALKKFGVKSQGELEGEKEKEFYDYIDKNWKSDKEEKGQLDEATAEIHGFRNDKEKSDAKSLAKKMGLKVDDSGKNIKISGAQKKISDLAMAAQKQGFKIDESYITEILKPSDDVSKWIEDFRKSDAPQFEGKDDEERREMAVAAWLSAREEAGIED